MSQMEGGREGGPAKYSIKAPPRFEMGEGSPSFPLLFSTMVVAVVSTRQMSPGSGRSRLAEAHKNDVPPLASTWGIVRSTNPDPTSLLMTRVIPRKPG